MSETFDPVADTQRELRDHDSGLNTLLIRRTYDATPEDVWDVLTDPERLVRWFLPNHRGPARRRAVPPGRQRERRDRAL